MQFVLFRREKINYCFVDHTYIIICNIKIRVINYGCGPRVYTHVYYNMHNMRCREDSRPPALLLSVTNSYCL